MKATVKMYRNDGAAQGLFPIKLIVTHQQKVKRRTLAKSSLADWDALKELPRASHPDFEKLYGLIMDIRAKAVRMDFAALSCVEQGMDHFMAKKRTAPPDFYSFTAKEVARMRGLGRNGNADAYQCSVDQLRKYAPALTFGQMDRFLLEGFKRQKQAEGLKNTSIRTYLYELRALYNSAVRLGLCVDARPFVGLFLDLPVRKRRAKNAYLSAAQLKKIAQMHLPIPTQQRAIDLCLMQFYLGGMDLVDVYFLKWEQICSGRIHLSRTKLGAKGEVFDVALLPKAKALLEKYADKQGPYVFPWRKDETGYKTFRSTHNHTLKRLQAQHGLDLLPNGGTLTTKVMRHTFATLAKFQGVDVDIIRELMGHERGDMDTVYKDRYPEAVRDAAHKKIIKQKF